MVNIVGDHATYHKEYDAPLTSEIEGVAQPFSDWVMTSADSRSVARDGADAVAAAMAPPGRIATLILPADASWNEADGPAPLPPLRVARRSHPRQSLKLLGPCAPASLRSCFWADMPCANRA
jgi:thiamine pyrophosphate-dependent acetolactate synthase large subunit-like protein